MERKQPESSILHIHDLDQASRANYSFILRAVRDEELVTPASDIMTSESFVVNSDVFAGIHKEGSENNLRIPAQEEASKLKSDDDPFADFNFREQDASTTVNTDGEVIDRTELFQQVTHSLPQISHAMTGLATAVGQTECGCGVDHSAPTSHTTFEPARPRHLEVVRDEPEATQATSEIRTEEIPTQQIVDELAQRRQLRQPVKVTDLPKPMNPSNVIAPSEPIQVQPSEVKLTRMQKIKDSFKRITKRITTFIKEKIFRRRSNVKK